jgi:hypothetical protein
LFNEVDKRTEGGLDGENCFLVDGIDNTIRGGFFGGEYNIERTDERKANPDARQI